MPDTPEKRFVELLDRLRRLAFGMPFEDSGVTMSQLTLLDVIAASPGAGIHDIATELGLTPPSVSVGVRRLEDAGLLTRQPDPKDGRAIQLFLTERGEEICRQAWAARRGKAHQLFSALNPQEQDTLFSLLERAITAAEETNSINKEEEK